MKLLAQLIPLQEAVAKLDAKTVVTSPLNTAEWAEVPLALRERAFFSATVEDADFLSAAQAKLMSALSLQKETVARGEAYVDRSSFIGDMRKAAQDAGIASGDGSLTDLSSRKRLGLIYDMQTQQATNFSRWKMDMNPAILDAYPAQELIRVEERKDPRDWKRRWVEAGGSIIDERMIALKTDPIWTDISAFGTPWPPFDFGSGMGLQDVSRRDAEDLGLIDPGETLEPTVAQFNDDLFASVTDLGADLIAALKTIFGDQISIADGIASWLGGAP